MIREKIRNYFKNRECVCLVRPMGEENRLANLEHENWDDLRPAFRFKISISANKTNKN